MSIYQTKIPRTYRSLRNDFMRMTTYRGIPAVKVSSIKCISLRVSLKIKNPCMIYVALLVICEVCSFKRIQLFA